MNRFCRHGYSRMSPWVDHLSRIRARCLLTLGITLCTLSATVGQDLVDQQFWINYAITVPVNQNGPMGAMLVCAGWLPTMTGIRYWCDQRSISNQLIFSVQQERLPYLRRSIVMITIFGSFGCTRTSISNGRNGKRSSHSSG